MLSIEKCKIILIDNNESYTDDEIKVIREYLYKMAKITTEAKMKDNNREIKKS